MILTQKQNYLDQLHNCFPIIGIDEAGKGEHLTPLVICGFLVEKKEDYQKLLDLGICDSKKLKKSKINTITQYFIKNHFIFDKITIHPKKYNELFDRMQNINAIIAWGHSKVIKNIFEKIKTQKTHLISDINTNIFALSDQFSNKKRIQGNLKEYPQVEFHEYTQAEKHLAVASASILAKYYVDDYMINSGIEFYKKNELSLPEKYTQIPISYGNAVSFCKEMVKKFGNDVLKIISKYHFKTTTLILKNK